MIILNGQTLEPGAPEITLLNRSFLFGDGIYESIRVFKGKPLFLKEHMERLIRGLTFLQFKFNTQSLRSLLIQELERLIQINQIYQHGRIRIHIYRAGTGAFKPLDDHPYYLMEGYSLKPDYYDFNAKIFLSLIDYKAIPLTFGLVSGFRTASALPYIMAAKFAQSREVDDVVLFGNQYIAETSQANIFVVKQQQVHTPSLETGCTNGIMRNQIIQLCKNLKIRVHERKFKSGFMAKADEVFLTNTLRGITAVKSYNKCNYPFSEYAVVPFLKKCLYQLIEATQP